MKIKNPKEINNYLYDSISDFCKNSKNLDCNSNYLLTVEQLLESNLAQAIPATIVKISSFFNSIDKSHAELPTFIQQQFSLDFFTKAKEFDQLVNYCKKNEFSITKDMGLVGKSILQEINNDFLLWSGNPEETKIYTRFLKEKKRWQTRSFKKIQKINRKVNTNYTFLDEYDLEFLYHKSPILKKIRTDLIIKKENMENIGCINISKEIDLAIKNTEEIISLEKFGFQRVAISKLINIISKETSTNYVDVFPITSMQQLNCSSAKKFIERCESFEFFNKKCCIFDHYAEIKWLNSDFSVIIGEIDTKSYFICLGFKE